MQLNELKQVASGRWADVLSSLGVARDSLDGRHAACPICDPQGQESKDRFRVFRDFDQSGGAVCNQCGKMADGIAVVQRIENCNFTEACQKIALVLGEEFETKKSKSKKKQPKRDKRLQLFIPDEWRTEDYRIRAVREWISHKPGIQEESVLRSRFAIGIWPRKAPKENQNRVIAFSTYDPLSWEPGSVILYRIDNKPFPPIGDKVEERKTHILANEFAAYRDGLFIVGSVDQFRESRVAWKCEGVTDTLALAGVLPGGEIACGNICGADSFPSPWLPAFRDFDRVIICGDNDQAGIAGAAKIAESCERNRRTSVGSKSDQF